MEHVSTAGDLSSLWAEAQVYTSQLSAIDRWHATVQFPDIGKGVEWKNSVLNPEINPEQE